MYFNPYSPDYLSIVCVCICVVGHEGSYVGKRGPSHLISLCLYVSIYPQIHKRERQRDVHFSPHYIE
jgi:hypothetical protein